MGRRITLRPIVFPCRSGPLTFAIRGRRVPGWFFPCHQGRFPGPATCPRSPLEQETESTMIRPERLTIKAQEAFRDAAAEASRRGNPVVNDAHLFAALLAQDEGVVRPLLQKA